MQKPSLQTAYSCFNKEVQNKLLLLSRATTFMWTIVHKRDTTISLKQLRSIAESHMSPVVQSLFYKP